MTLGVLHARPPDKRPSLWRTIFTRRMLVALIMGFASGLPLLTQAMIDAGFTDEEIEKVLVAELNGRPSRIFSEIDESTYVLWRNPASALSGTVNGNSRAPPPTPCPTKAALI